MKTIIVVAPWSSGSTAVTGFLDCCGVFTCPPHEKTNDERTPNSFEPSRYADALRSLIDELNLERKGDAENFETFFESFFHSEVQKAEKLGLEAIALKHPLQTFVLPYLNSFLRPKYVLVTRPVEEIEATRERRRWPPIYGAQGAQRIYSTATKFLIENSCSYLSIPYNALIHDATVRKTLLDFCGLSPTDEMLRNADDFLKR